MPQRQLAGSHKVVTDACYVMLSNNALLDLLGFSQQVMVGRGCMASANFSYARKPKRRLQIGQNEPFTLSRAILVVALCSAQFSVSFNGVDLNSK